MEQPEPRDGGSGCIGTGRWDGQIDGWDGENGMDRWDRAALSKGPLQFGVTAWG